ncbi:MAG: TIGR01777 family oxidoreductase, partial [candidate division WOR-3 bacterium]
MKIFIAGGSGLIGRHLKAYLSKDYDVILVSRFKGKGLTYDELHKHISDGDVIVNLAGENISKRWNERVKRNILESRVNTGRVLVDEIKKSGKRLKLFVQASAVGFYGRDRNTEFTEESQPLKEDFLTQVVRNWEDSTREIEDLGIKRVITRFGVVLSKDAKAFKLMVLPFKFFVGGIIGDGKQWMSWIHIEDLCSIVEYLILNEKTGIYNVVSPNPITNEGFSRILAKKMTRHLNFHIP